MRKFLLVLFSFIFTTVVGQKKMDTVQSYVPVIYGGRLKVFLDSIKNQILDDTIKYDRTKLVITATGRRNTQPYSPLFIINGAYLYKLDIINGSDVLEFVNEILDDKKIRSITIIESSKASEHFGHNACGRV